MRAIERIHEYGRLAANLRERRDAESASMIATMCDEDLEPWEPSAGNADWLEGRARDYIRMIATFLRPLENASPEDLHARAEDILEQVSFFEACE